MVKSLPNRSEVSIEETWNLTDLFATEKDFDAALEGIKKEVTSFANNYKGKIDSASTI
jgi:oligoendopeptidase F